MSHQQVGLEGDRILVVLDVEKKKLQLTLYGTV